MEQAPSLIFDELAAVMVPVLLKAGANELILSSLYLFHSSSSSKISSAFLSLILIGVISSFNNPLLTASMCLLYDNLQYSSWASLVILKSSAVF